MLERFHKPDGKTNRRNATDMEATIIIAHLIATEMLDAPNANDAEIRRRFWVFQDECRRDVMLDSKPLMGWTNLDDAELLNIVHPAPPGAEYDQMFYRPANDTEAVAALALRERGIWVPHVDKAEADASPLCVVLQHKNDRDVRLNGLPFFMYV